MGARRRQSPRQSPNAGERLQKVIAAAGVASRRRAEELISGGHVSVNGRVVTELGVRVSGRAKIEVDGVRLRQPRRRYYLLNKPRGVVSTTEDAHAAKTVVDLLPTRERLFPVGRLDAATEGLILLTNDGEVAQRMLHPRFEVPRVYRVVVNGCMRADALRALAQGIELEGRPTAPCDVKLLEQTEARSVIEMVMIEGRHRQIREMLDAVGHPVRRLLRTRFGPLRLRGLAAGQWRPLEREEVDALQRMLAEAEAQ